MNNKDMAEFAENLWKNYIGPKMEAEHTGAISYYRATVISNNGDGTLTVKPACDNERTVNHTFEVSDIAEGDGVLIMRIGNGNAASNHLAFARTNALNPILNMGEGFMPTGIISISSNGVYDVTNYASANVDVDTGMYTADEIAEKTISGALYGSSASNVLSETFANNEITAASFPLCESIGTGAFFFCTELTTIDFPVCTHVGNNAFGYCYSLKTASFPNCVRIGADAFVSCRTLETADCPKCSYIDDAAFLRCPALKTVSFPNCSIVNAHAFQECGSLLSANFPVCSGIGGGAFQACFALTEAIFPECRVVLNWAFEYCSEMSRAVFPVCASIGLIAFAACVKLVSFYLTSVSSVTTLGVDAFYGTPIGGYSDVAGRYGSVFVPSSLYSQFIVATNWTSISSRIVPV